MSNKTVETKTPVTATSQQPILELPSLDRIQIQAIMAAIIFARRDTTYDPESPMYAKDVRSAVSIAADLLERIEQEERGYIARCSEDERDLLASVQSQG
jgi:hypothetical protein